MWTGVWTGVWKGVAEGVCGVEGVVGSWICGGGVRRGVTGVVGNSISLASFSFSFSFSVCRADEGGVERERDVDCFGGGIYTP